MKLYTAGHSTVELDDFVELMTTNEIEVVADVRSKPRSRLPHFDQVPLETALHDARVSYRFLGDRLGGMPRDPRIAQRCGVDVDADYVTAGANERNQHAAAATRDFQHSSSLSARELEVQRQIAVKGEHVIQAGELPIAPGLLRLDQRAVLDQAVAKHASERILPEP